MNVLDGAICGATLAISLGLGWFLPRRLGFIGIFLAHVEVSLLVFLLIVYDIARGAVPDPDFIYLLGNACWMALANVLLLPVTGFATYRHTAHLHHADTEA